MKLFGWLRGNARANDTRARWREGWNQAVENPDRADLDALRRELNTSRKADDDIEVELEMLEALEQLQEVRRAAAANALPPVTTQHRVIGTETCHFTAPASVPDDSGQTSGRLLLTPTRGIFVGGGRTLATAWHLVHDVVRLDRDVLFVKADRSPAAHLRLNTYGDAVVTAFLARHFKDLRRSRL